jgi:hypothetical protein
MIYQARAFFAGSNQKAHHVNPFKAARMGFFLAIDTPSNCFI